MALDFKYNPDSSSSEFNEAWLKLRRFHELQDQINKCRVNPLMSNPVTNSYNFEVWFQHINSLFMEIIADVDEEEQQELEKLRESIKEHMYKYPIYQQRKNLDSGSKTVIDHSSFRVLEKFLTRYECLIRKFISKYGYATKYNNPDYDGL